MVSKRCFSLYEDLIFAYVALHMKVKVGGHIYNDEKDETSQIQGSKRSPYSPRLELLD